MDCSEGEPKEIQHEVMKSEFDKKFDVLNMDQKMFTTVGPNIEHYRHFIENRFDTVQQEQINNAFLKMLELHKDQNARPDGMPYISHPLEVSRTIVEDFEVNDIDLITASLLHDSVEDQGLKLAEAELKEKYGDSVETGGFKDEHMDEIRALALTKIAEQFGERTAEIVSKLSSPDFNSLALKDTDPVDKEKFQARKHELYKEHIEDTIQDPDVLVIKLADFIHNISDACKLPESPQKVKYRQKYVPVTPIFLNRLNINPLPVSINNKENAIMKLNEATSILSQSG